MKIGKRLKILFITVAAFAGALFAGCKIGEQTADEFLEENGAREQIVTYYGNGGSFNGRTEKSLHYRAGQEIILDFSKTKTEFARSGFVFSGWYYVQMKDGEPLFEDENKTLAVKGNPVDMSKPLTIKEKEHIYLCADWGLDYRLEYVLVTDDDSEITTANGNVKSGEVLRWDAFGGSNALTPSSIAPVASTSHTFLALYSDKACTTQFTGSVQRPTGEGAENPKIYAKYIKGKWTIVKTANDVSNMLTTGGSNYYIFNDIDCKGVSIGLYSGDFKSIIEGNGKTLTNLSISQTNLTSGTNMSLFGNITADARISDLTFKDVTVTTSVRQNASLELFLFANDIKDGAVIENVSIRNVVFTITKPDTSTIRNIQFISGAYETDNWLCGGVNSSDSAFLAKYSGLKIYNATLKIGRNSGSETVVATYNAAD